MEINLDKDRIRRITRLEIGRVLSIIDTLNKKIDEDEREEENERRIKL